MILAYTFELPKERKDLGSKFDNVIFRCEFSDDSWAGKYWRYRYLQAKHKENMLDKLKASELVQDEDKGNFSTLKYFRSFCKMKTTGEDNNDCIPCMNITFDVDDVKKNGVVLVTRCPSKKNLKMPEDFYILWVAK
jgi:hypothetical protein